MLNLNLQHASNAMQAGTTTARPPPTALPCWGYLHTNGPQNDRRLLDNSDDNTRSSIAGPKRDG
jgi:hypothetical protein